MKAAGLKPTQVVYNTMLFACERGRDLPRALALLQEMTSSGVPRDVITWNTIISACKECGDWERARALLDEMQEDGILPDTISYNAAIAACAKAGAVEQARKLLARMQQTGVARDTCSYNSLMDAYARAGSFPAVLQTLEAMMSQEGGEDSKVRPDVISFTQALSAAEKTRDFEAADRLLSTMKKEGVKWNQYTYAVVLSICGKAGRWPQAIKLLQAMRRRGLTPDSTCYTVVMNACASAGKLRRCLALLDAMRDDGVAPTIHTFTVLLTAAVSQRELRTALRLYREMSKAMIQPNGVFLSSVINSLIEVNQTSTAQTVSAHRTFVRPGVPHLCPASEALWLLCVQVLRRIERAPTLTLDLPEYHVLLRAICRRGHLNFAQCTSMVPCASSARTGSPGERLPRLTLARSGLVHLDSRAGAHGPRGRAA